MADSQKSWSWSDLLVFFVLVPLLLLSIFFLPQSVKKEYFILNRKDPSISSIFLCNYTHSDWAHLRDNLGWYYLAMFLIFNVITERRIFHRMMLFLFVLLPFIISFANLLIFRSGSTQGFSGIVAGLYGYFLFAVCSNLKNRQGIREIDESFPAFIFSLNALIVAIIHLSVFLLVISVSACVFLGFLARKGMKGFLRWLDEFFTKTPRSGVVYGTIVLVFSFFAVFQLPLLLPAEIVADGKMINTLAHYLGYTLGLSVPLFVYRLRSR